MHLELSVVQQAAFPGGGNIRKVAMRGRTTPRAAGNTKAHQSERKWTLPKMKSPHRACQAA